MKSGNIPVLRLASQRITASEFRTPVQLVAAMGGLQAQDYAAALWAIGLRVPGATEKTVEQAVATREIVRT